MKVYMLLARNNFRTDIVRPGVKASIEGQTLKNEIVFIYDEEKNSTDKYYNIARGHDIGKKLTMESSDEFMVFQDSDIKHLYTNNFELMQKFLREHENFGGVALGDTMGKLSGLLEYDPKIDNHICQTCCMLRKNALKNVDFSIIGPYGVCSSQCVSLSKVGWRYGYLSKELRLENVGDNK